jgi:hypothetical protein
MIRCDPEKVVLSIYCCSVVSVFGNFHRGTTGTTLLSDDASMIETSPFIDSENFPTGWLYPDFANPDVF